jgi:hypothetical protein
VPPVEFLADGTGAVGAVSEKAHATAGRQRLGGDEEELPNRLFRLALRIAFLSLQTGHVLLTLDRGLYRFLFRFSLGHGFLLPKKLPIPYSSVMIRKT